ncbi:GT-D fold domain-containing glycosyltransferase [Alkalibacterium thalassium]|uniref:Glycosyltransferase, SP_1767 family n=1 Tax=Alkalibacterium thalassium TaxID=426701 RepID=A0A1G9BM43_9LACT|nr:GT-D fold domain-containing glycosyltransferase [Alkalibacterium thalassium]SDK40463.1 glycosyltransferase, SP_1767 family [Alkalibacterium thalassium]
MNNRHMLIKIKRKLMQSVAGRSIIRIYHYVIAVPLAKMYELKYHILKNKFKDINFYSIEETFGILENERKSLCRYGDGEISWIYKDSKGYFGQENSEELSNRLREILNVEDQRVLIGIPDFFGPMLQYSRKRVSSRNVHLSKYYKRWMELIEENRIYADALITRVHHGRIDGKSEYIFNLWKKVWDNKKVIIIEGEKTRFGVGNNLLDNSFEVIRIIAPAENAFSKYEDIWNISKKYINPNVLFLIALGPTATVLSYDIGVNGGQAIDIGHLDIEYEWYLSGARKKMPIYGKYVNEAGGIFQSELPREVLEKYESEIVEKVK